MPNKSWFQKYATSEEEIVGKQNTITAHAGGGQGSATALTALWNRIDTCASDFDSCKLIAAPIGGKQVVFNNTNKTVAIYPVSGNKINQVANYQYNIPPGKVGIFESYEDNAWQAYVTTVDNVILTTSVNLSKAQIQSLNASPVDAIAAPGAGLAIECLSAWEKYSYDGSYTGSGAYNRPQLRIFCQTANADQMNGPQITVPSSNYSTPYIESQRFQIVTGVVAGTPPTQAIIENKKVQISCLPGATTSAAFGIATVYITYRIVTL